jgi:predicted RNase H-like HicB family nuclease
MPEKTHMGSVNLELDEDSEWTAHSVEFPGCTWWAPTKEEAIRLAPGEVSAFISWLRSQGEEGLPETTASFEVLEEGFGRWTSDSYFADYTFGSDLRLPSRSEIERSLRWLGYSRRDLVELTHHLDQASLQLLTGPPGKVRTIEAMLEHIADVEWWYLHNLRMLEGARPPPSPERQG